MQSISQPSLAEPPPERMPIIMQTPIRRPWCLNPIEPPILQKEAIIIIKSSRPLHPRFNPPDLERAQRSVARMKTEMGPAGSQGRRHAGLSQRTACKGFQNASTPQWRGTVEEVEAVEGEAAVVNQGARNNSKEGGAVGAGSPPWNSAKTRLSSHPCRPPCKALQLQTKGTIVQGERANLAPLMQRMSTHTPPSPTIISTWSTR